MEKTKLGISVGLLAAALYVLGLVNTLALVVLAGYVLLHENNEWLKKMAIKSLAIVLCFSILSAVLGVAGNTFDIIEDMIQMATSFMKSFNFRLTFFDQLISIVRSTLSATQAILLLLCAYKALKQEEIAVGPVDSILNKYL